MPFDHVHFLPWIGDQYANGGFHERKLLIVGESHYTGWHDDDGVYRNHELGPNFTQECVEAMMHTGGAAYWNRVQFRIAGDEGRWTRPKDFWPKVAFYNFVQSEISGTAGRRPTGHQFASSAPALMEVLDDLRPDRVVFTGNALWWHVPPRSGTATPISSGELSIPQEWFDLNVSHRSYVTKIPHPRSSKCVRALEPLVDTFIRSDLPLV